MHWPESAGDSCWLLVDEGSKKDLLEQLDWNCSRIMYYQSPILTARNHPTQPKRLSSMSCDAACCPKEETCSCRHQIIRFASVCWMTGLVLTQERQGTLKCAHHLGEVLLLLRQILLSNLHISLSCLKSLDSPFGIMDGS